MSTHSNHDKPRRPDGPWQPGEDAGLRDAIARIHGPQALRQRRPGEPLPLLASKSFGWSDIAKTCQEFGHCMRDAKQCRERWVNHLDPNLDKRPFTPEQVAWLLAYVKDSRGRKWADIGRIMGKPENSCKNCYYQHKKKEERNAPANARHQHGAHTMSPDPNLLYPSHNLRYRRESTTSNMSNYSSSSNPGLTFDAASPEVSSPRSPIGPFRQDQRQPHPLSESSKPILSVPQFSLDMHRSASNRSPVGFAPHSPRAFDEVTPYKPTNGYTLRSPYNPSYNFTPEHREEPRRDSLESQYRTPEQEWAWRHQDFRHRPQDIHLDAQHSRGSYSHTQTLGNAQMTQLYPGEGNTSGNRAASSTLSTGPTARETRSYQEVKDAMRLDNFVS